MYPPKSFGYPIAIRSEKKKHIWDFPVLPGNIRSLPQWEFGYPALMIVFCLLDYSNNTLKTAGQKVCSEICMPTHKDYQPFCQYWQFADKLS